MVIARHRTEIRFAIVIAFGGILTGLLYLIELWALDERGFSLLSQRLPYWDFTNLWAGATMALHGHVDDLFDMEKYRAALRHMFGQSLPDQEWSYPPSILLIGAPLAQLSIGWAYLVWTLCTLLLLYGALKPFGLPPMARLLVTFSPATVMSLVFGQNGVLTAALLVSGLALAPKRPWFAGLLFGLLTIKPHLGILVPVCLLAARNYRAFFSAMLTTLLLVGLTALCFGHESWNLFLTETAPLMRAIMEAAYPQPYHKNAMTVFILVRWAGFDLSGAYLIQGLAIAVCSALSIWLWRPSSDVGHLKRVCITGVLAIIATPYGYSYDAIPLCIAAAHFFLTERTLNRWFLAVVYLWPQFLHIPNDFGAGIAILIPIAFVVVVIVTEVRSTASSTPPARLDDSCPSAG